MNPIPSVSAIVPARNEEATITPAVESLAAQPEMKEIFVINDQSSDGTAAQLARLSSRYTQLRVLETHGIPGGWMGKNYAVSLGAAQATGTGCCSPMPMACTCRVRRRTRWPTRRLPELDWYPIRRSSKRAHGGSGL